MSPLFVFLWPLRCIAFQQGRYLQTLFFLLFIRGARMYITQWDHWAIEVCADVFVFQQYVFLYKCIAVEHCICCLAYHGMCSIIRLYVCHGFCGIG